MKVISLFFMFCVLGGWYYTSWYWYTCKIKGFCDESEREVSQEIERETSPEREELFTVLAEAEEVIPVELPEDSLSSSDTLIVTEVNIPKEDKVLDQEETAEQKEEEINNEEIEVDEQIEKTEEQEEIISGEGIASGSCEAIIGPIAKGSENTFSDILKLEKVLVNEGFSVKTDGIYGDDDFEAVKEFQKRYRSEILDPWGIINPTGFVYTTTVKKMNEILCK